MSLLTTRVQGGYAAEVGAFANGATIGNSTIRAPHVPRRSEKPGRRGLFRRCPFHTQLRRRVVPIISIAVKRGLSATSTTTTGIFSQSACRSPTVVGASPTGTYGCSDSLYRTGRNDLPRIPWEGGTITLRVAKLTLGRSFFPISASGTWPWCRAEFRGQFTYGCKSRCDIYATVRIAKATDPGTRLRVTWGVRHAA